MVANAEDRPVFCRAAPLSERLRNVAAIVGDASSGGRRLGHWRDRHPFSESVFWDEKLRSDGVDEPLLKNLLGESTESLHGRLGDADWADWLTGGLDDDIRLELDDSDEELPYFAPIACDLLTPTIRRLETELAAMAETATDSGFDAATLTRQLQEELLWSVHTMFGRTMALEINLARTRGDLTGETSDERFDQFLDRLRDPLNRRRLFADYPVLARQLTVRVRQWYDNSLRMVGRIITDAPLLSQEFTAGAPLGILESISINAGDQHRRGQSVAMVRWSGGLTLVYKPRSMKLDIAFARLLDWLNRAGLPHALTAAHCLDRGEYGWSELIVTSPCEDVAGVRRFYHRQGALLALLGLMRTNDMHAENLIAVGEHPVLVDLETLMQPQLPNSNPRQTAAEHLATEATATSVLHIGLLPTPSWITREGRAVDISGLGHRPGQRSSMTVPMLSDFGKDTMRITMERVDMELPDHRPVAKDTPLNLLDYADDLVEGYTRMHRLCRERRDDLLAEDGPLEAFRGTEVRVLVQSTIVYATLLRTGFHPDVLRDGLDRDKMFDFLWRRVDQTPDLAATIPAERRDLWRNDVPFFTAETDGDRLIDSDGAPVPGLTVTPGLELVRKALFAWDEEHLAGQLTLIKGALAAATMNNSDQYDYPDYGVPEPSRSAPHDRLVETAVRLGDELHSQAFRSHATAQWLGLNSHMGRNWRLGPLSPDLFNGISGVTLFLAELSRASGEERFARLAHHALVTLKHQINREGTHTLHGMAGLPGIAYTLCRLSELLSDESLHGLALELTARTLPEVSADAEFDIVAGGAGTIAALRIVHTLHPGGPAADVIRAAADHLVRSAQSFGKGVGWMPALITQNNLASQPLSGFGHGTGGIAWALGEAAHLLGEPRYAEVARTALDYERELFDPQTHTWSDVRAPDGQATINAWCHGSVGIGLSRLGVRETLFTDDSSEVDTDIDITLAGARRDGFGISHSLCHGDAGAVDLFLSAGASLDRQALRDEAGRHAAAMLHTIDERGFLCGLPYGQAAPSLMVGLSGIGYQLLRVADPDHVPSVLSLSVPGRHGRP